MNKFICIQVYFIHMKMLMKIEMNKVSLTSIAINTAKLFV